MKLKIQDGTVYDGMPFNKDTIENMLFWEIHNIVSRTNKIIIYSR